MAQKQEAAIHPSAVVETGAVIGKGSRVGPFCHVGPDVTIGENVDLLSHVVVMGATTIGDGCKVFPQAVLGALPQNLKHTGGRTTLTIGRNTIIRESVTMHIGSDTSRGATIVGDNGYFMAYSHVAHDCTVGNNVTMANGATLAGHCEIGDNVVIGGLTAVHQFARIGNNAFLSGCSAVPGDVIPFGLARGNLAKLRGLNVVGMRRSGMSKADIQAVRRAYRTIFDRSRPLSENLDIASRDFADSSIAMSLVAFLSERGKRYFVTPPLDGAIDDGADDES
ncbi:MAG TPA: acyl-ACP--UDP-N-acetylglucosamine O-acyltransferase [Rhizobiaceae bacterium]|nr:acyl-ACP--UDP-N-acetylglucosamine O-acyltransferase [Rhizobiaceae bacterium]